MKRISAVYVLFLLASLSLLAADAPAAAPQLTLPSPLTCSLNLKGVKLPPKPLFKGMIPPPCIAQTSCDDGSTASCPVSYSTACWTSEGCWAMCEDGSFSFCPGKQGAPECPIY
jgi:hypothetical protein